MSYLVLARKWRPQTFSDLVGQEHVSRTLKNAIDGGRVAHAFLFTGARGVGKTSSARILAKALNCEGGTSVEPCNRCSACLEITEGNSVDVFEIDGASNTSVDDIRELRENIKYLPSRSRYKIFIIDEVHMLSTSAFNALLKTLEEPPAHVKFIFATTEPHKVPITILSRCQRFDFKRIPLTRIVERLRYIVDQEGVEMSDQALALVARKGDGSMRDSLSTLDQVLAFCGDRVADADVAGLLGVVDRRLLVEGCQAVFAGDSRGVLEILARVDGFGYSMRQFCQELIDQFRSIAILCAVKEGGELLELSEPELEELSGLAAQRGIEELQRHLSILLKAEAEMAQASFPRLILELALLRMAALRPAIAVQELLERLKALESGAVSAGAPRPVEAASPPRMQPVPAASARSSAPPAAAAPAAAPPASAEAAPADPGFPVDLDDPWGSLVRFVKGKRPMLAAVLEQVRPLRVSPQQLEIGCPQGSWEFRSLQDQDNLNELKALAQQLFGGKPQLRVLALNEAAPDAPPTLSEKKTLEDAERQASLMREAREHPLVAAAIDLFDGEIAEVKELGNERRN